MPGRYSNDWRVRLLGVAFFLVAAVGTVVFDWRFGGSGDPLPTALGLVAVGVALAVTLLRT
ncbi:MAG: hypothetical protein ABEI77_06670 [Halorientalis sp.]